MRRFMLTFAGAVIGALVGGLAALMLAPTSGEALRQRMRDRVGGLREEVREAYHARRAQLEAELEALRKPGSSD